MTRDVFMPDARVAHGSDSSIVVREVPTGMRISIGETAIVISIEDWEELIGQEAFEERAVLDYQEQQHEEKLRATN